MKQLVTTTSEIKAHAKYSASGSERWLACPGSIALSENAPPQRESEYAIEGTDAHACLEFFLRNKSIPDEKVRKKASVNWTDEDMVNHAVDARQYILKRWLDIPGSELLVETKVDATPFTTKGQFGTLDVAIVEEWGKLVIMDYKYGAGHAVDPEDNSQLIYYALGIAEKYDYNFASVEIVVIQPRAWHHTRKTIRSWETTIEELLKWKKKFLAGVEACEEAAESPSILDMYLVSGSHCNWCPAATICPAIKDQAMKNAQMAFDEVDGSLSVQDPKSIAIKNLPTILNAADAIEGWIEAVRLHALHVLERGEKIQGRKLVQKRSTRKWTNPLKVEKEARKSFGNRAFTKPELLSPAQLEKVAGEKWVEKRVSDISSGYTIALESDKRPEVNKFEDIFGEVENEVTKDVTYTKSRGRMTGSKDQVQKIAKKKKKSQKGKR